MSNEYKWCIYYFQIKKIRLKLSYAASTVHCTMYNVLYIVYIVQYI